MCDNCPKENKAEWTRETSKPTGERPLPAPSGQDKSTRALDHLYNPSISDLELDEQHDKDRPVVYLDQAVAAIDAAVKEAYNTAADTVLRATEIPKDAKNPTRDALVVWGEDMAHRLRNLNQTQEKK